ncbi:hypothetical protein IMG5_192810, partial [Ichthyophthirius multifiliis]
KLISDLLPKSYSLQFTEKLKRKKKAINFYINTLVTPKPLKKIKRNHSQTKYPNNQNYQNLLTCLQKHPQAGPFLQPVNPQLQGCPDYLQIITHPMDLSTIQNNLRQNKYRSDKQFLQDIRQIWSNSYIYNPKSSYLYQVTLQMDQFFEQKVQEIFQNKNNNPLVNLHNQVNQLQKEISGMNSKSKTLKAFNNQNLSYFSTQKQQKINTPMNPNEKKTLKQNILKLPADAYTGVWEILKQECNTRNQQLSFDIDALSVRKVRELEQYVNMRLNKHQKKLVKLQQKTQKKKKGSDEENSITLQNQPLIQQENSGVNISQTI